MGTQRLVFGLLVFVVFGFHQLSSFVNLKKEGMVVMVASSSSKHNTTPNCNSNTSTTTKYGLVVVHCKENATRTAWYHDIPTQNSNWDVNIYETCGQDIFPPFSRPFANAGPEECTAYLDYILQRYHGDGDDKDKNNNHSLPDISIFLQSDTFRNHSNWERYNGPAREGGFKITGHSPFTKFDQLITAINDHNQKHHNSSSFVHFGWPFHILASKTAPNAYNAFTEDYFHEIWDLVARQTQDPSNSNSGHHYINERYHSFNGTAIGRPGAIFAVSRDRILANPRWLYQKIKDTILQPKPDDDLMASKKRCCALEGTWHVLFGEHPRIPTEATVDYLYENYTTWQI